MRDHITLRSAALLSGLAPRAVYELCRVGTIRARTVRERWRVHRRGFLAWLAGRVLPDVTPRCIFAAVAETEYERYIGSLEWARLREEQLAWDEYRCRLCGRTDVPLEVHHTDYFLLGHERVGRDLLSLCIECHDFATNQIRSDRYARREPLPPTPTAERPLSPEFPESRVEVAPGTTDHVPPRREAEHGKPDRALPDYRDSTAHYAQRATRQPAEPARQGDEEGHVEKEEG